MDKEARGRFIKFFKDEKKYEFGHLNLFLDDLEYTHIDVMHNKGKEIYSLGIKDNENNRKVLSKYLKDLDEFFKELENTIYAHNDNEYQLLDFVLGADNIDIDGQYLNFGYRYHESMGKDMFYLYTESELNSIPWL